MRKKYYNVQKLPSIKITQKTKLTKTKTTYQKINQRFQSFKISKSNSICNILTSVRTTMKTKIQDQKSLEKNRKRFEQKIKRKENFVNKKQKKLYYYQTTPTKQNQIIGNDNLFRFTRTLQTIQVNTIQTLIKPPHRQKTTICYDNQKLYLYGGIGCEQNLRLAIFDLNTQEWKFPLQQHHSQYQQYRFLDIVLLLIKEKDIFMEDLQQIQLMNYLLQILLIIAFLKDRNAYIVEKIHAVLMLSKYMIVHGGIQSNQISNTMYYYDTQKNYWGYFNKGIYDLPFLSHHSITSTFPSKTKKRINSLFDISDPIFIFGGKDKNENISDILYRIYIQNQNIKVNIIETNKLINPQKRFSCCFHYVGNNTLLLYGGRKSESEQLDKEQKNNYNDVFTLNTQKLEWNQQNTSQILPTRYGMASTSYLGKIYVFGGFVDNKYSDANLTILSSWTPDLLKTKSNFNLGTRSILSGDKFY